MTEEIKTPEQTRTELFQTEPENFKHLTEMSICITQPEGDNKQRQILVNTGNIMEMGGLIFMLLRHCLRVLDSIDALKAQDKALVQSLTSKKGFNSFIRGKR